MQEIEREGGGGERFAGGDEGADRRFKAFGY